MLLNKSTGLAAFWSDDYFPALDGLRAICILLVLFNHIHTGYPRFILGWTGVDIFFVLSGFLITTLLLREREKYGDISLKGFYARRFFRIIPVYLVVLAAYVPTILILHDAKRWLELKAALPYLLTFMQEFRPEAAANIYGQTWSLGYEEKFYLVWPLLTIVLFPFRKRSLWITVLIGAGLVLLPAQTARSYGGLFLGSLLAIVLDKRTHIGAQGLVARIPTTLAGVAVAGTYVALYYNSKLILLYTFAITLLTSTIVLNKGWLRTLLENRWIVLFGKRSYAMYLVHVLVLNFVEAVAIRLHAFHWYVVVPAAYLASFAAATFLYHLVEKPCVAYGRKLSRRYRQDLVVKRELPVKSVDVTTIGIHEDVATIARKDS